MSNIYLSICLSISLSIYLSIYISIYLSVYHFGGSGCSATKITTSLVRCSCYSRCDNKKKKQKKKYKRMHELHTTLSKIRKILVQLERTRDDTYYFLSLFLSLSLCLSFYQFLYTTLYIYIYIQLHFISLYIVFIYSLPLIFSVTSSVSHSQRSISVQYVYHKKHTLTYERLMLSKTKKIENRTDN